MKLGRLLISEDKHTIELLSLLQSVLMTEIGIKCSLYSIYTVSSGVGNLPCFTIFFIPVIPNQIKTPSTCLLIVIMTGKPAHTLH